MSEESDAVHQIVMRVCNHIKIFCILLYDIIRLFFIAAGRSVFLNPLVDVKEQKQKDLKRLFLSFFCGIFFDFLLSKVNTFFD